MNERTTCPKCGAASGNDWSQCKGSCPMPGSPHYKPERTTMTTSNVRKFLDLSTGHLKLSTRRVIDQRSMCAYPHPNGYGWFVWIPTDPSTTMYDGCYYPEDLILCFTKGRELGCDYILFDCDADQMEGLPFYEDGEEPVQP